MPIDDETQKEIDLRMRIASVKADLGENIDPDLFEINNLTGDDRSGNANPFVPWSDPQIPFECDCGAIIYADSAHTHDQENPPDQATAWLIPAEEVD